MNRLRRFPCDASINSRNRRDTLTRRERLRSTSVSDESSAEAVGVDEWYPASMRIGRKSSLAVPPMGPLDD